MAVDMVGERIESWKSVRTRRAKDRQGARPRTSGLTYIAHTPCHTTMHKFRSAESRIPPCVLFGRVLHSQRTPGAVRTPKPAKAGPR